MSRESSSLRNEWMRPNRWLPLRYSWGAYVPDGDAELVLALRNDELLHDGRPADGLQEAVVDFEHLRVKDAHFPHLGQLRQEPKEGDEPKEQEDGKEHKDSRRQLPHACKRHGQMPMAVTGEKIRLVAVTVGARLH